MQLLGIYKSNLAPFHYQELLKLIEEAVAAGDFAGNSSFDQKSIDDLKAAAQNFAALPLPSAGQRITEDALNNPLQLLRARFNAITSEIADFNTRSAALLDVIKKDSTLIDQIIAAAGLESWSRTKLPLTGADEVKWDYSMGVGSVATDITRENPSNGVIYPNQAVVTPIYDSSTGLIGSGLLPYFTSNPVKPKNLTWTFTTTGQSEVLSGTDWAELSLLENQPLVSFTSNPSVSVILPLGGSINSIFEVGGQTTGIPLPVYLRILFYPRRNSASIRTSDATSSSLSTYIPIKPLDKLYVEAMIRASAGTDGSMKAELALYKSDNSAILNDDGSTKTVPLPPVAPSTVAVKSNGIVIIPDIPEVAFAKLQFTMIANTMGTWFQDSFRVHAPASVSANMLPDSVSVSNGPDSIFFVDEDFVADDSGQVTMLDVPDSLTLSIRFTEQFPAYECSINNNDWSPPVMLDPTRPYVDTETSFRPLGIIDGKFPITDELGSPTGLYLRMLAQPTVEYVLQVTVPPSDANPGAKVQLEIDFERPSYMNTLSLSPFTTFPIRIDSIETQAFTSDTTSVVYNRNGQPGLLLDQELAIRFSRSLVRKIFISLYQENYSIKTYSITPPDELRREALSSLQAALPNAEKRVQRIGPSNIRGYLYEFGIENIAGLDVSLETPTVFVAGPYRLTGCPEVLKFDVDYQGSPSFYLCFRAYDQVGAEIDINIVGVSIADTNCIAFPWANDADTTKVANSDVYLKIVFNTSSDIVKKFMYQVTKV